MDGIHDLGGMEGFGPVPVRSGDAGYTGLPGWEQRMWALSRSIAVPGITIDQFRHVVELMVPSDYLGFAYFNKWCTTYLVFLLNSGMVEMAEIRRGPGPPGVPEGAARTLSDVLERNRALDTSFECAVPNVPAFEIGQAVETRRDMHSGHTRLPRYARGRRGEVVAQHGGHALPDEGARGNHVGAHLYTVCFRARELWGEAADPRDTVMLDLWESYLVPA